jgi:Flp pilus assembly pilin Flp
MRAGAVRYKALFEIVGLVPSGPIAVCREPPGRLFRGNAFRCRKAASDRMKPETPHRAAPALAGFGWEISMLAQASLPIRRLIADRRGLKAIEYGILAAFVVVAVAALAGPLDILVDDIYSTMRSKVPV